MVRVVRSSGAYDLPFTVQWQHGALRGNTFPASPSISVIDCDLWQPDPLSPTLKTLRCGAM